MAFFICPVCGEEVDKKAKSCPNCGADEETGWGDTHMDGVDLYDDEDYKESRAREFGEGPQAEKSGKRILFFIVAIGLLALMLAAYFM
ncbi:MAG: zinc ribbon domain-containing protein [Fibrobacterota bacterium]